MNKNKKNVTIIIPVYKDFTTLKKCVQSLKKFVDPRHKILIVNDCSPEANMGRDILEEIDKDSRFIYYKNNQNLGFVKTCNKAAKELDKSNNDILLLNSDTEVTDNFLEEMLDILYYCEKHGIVCPRSNNATILSVPLYYDEDRSKIINESYACYLKIKDLLPRFNVIPTAVGFCMLIKRELIKRYDFFDEIYSSGYNEENDFSMRINGYGYSTVMANHSFVFHHETKSFSMQERKELNEQNEKILLERYPYYFNLVSNYIEYQVNPVDHFSDVIDTSFSRKAGILFSLYNLPALHNGTSEYGLSMLSNFMEKYKDKYDIDILTTQVGAEFHKLSETYHNIFYPDTIAKHYHIAICPSQIVDINHLLLLNRHSLKILVTVQDIIALRYRFIYIQKPDAESLFVFTRMFSDGIITFTDDSEKDLLAYFEPFSTQTKISIRVIPPGISNAIDDMKGHILNNEKPSLGKNNKVRSWEDVAHDTGKFVADILSEPIDSKKLAKRWYSLLTLEQQIRERDRQITGKDRQITGKDRQITEKDRQITEKDRQITEWKDELNRVVNRRLYKTLDKLLQKTRIYKVYAALTHEGMENK